MLLLLVGPSGVGKTTLGQYASENIPACEFYDLDDLVRKQAKSNSAYETALKEGWEGFFDLCQKEVEKIDNIDDARIHIIAVGAGTLMSSRAAHWLKNYITVTIFAGPDEVLPRNPMGPRRTIDDFMNVEYNNNRESIYKQSHYLLDVSGKSKENAQRSFVDLIRNKILQLNQ